MAKSYRQSQFDNLQKKDVNKSLFNLSHEVKTQMCFGRYYPVLFEECLPGDEWEIDAEYNFRFPGLYFPIQQIGTMRADWFYCPYKLMWKGTSAGTNISAQKLGWQGFIMGENLELPTTKLNINGAGYASTPASQLYPGCSYPIENYLGFPFDTHGRLDEHKQTSVVGSAFPLAMYLFCYDEYYRNPQWEEPIFFDLQDGDNTENFDIVEQVIGNQIMVQWAPTVSNNVINHPPFFAHYEKDYFTSARPEPQDGDAILIPSVEEGFPKEPTIWKDILTGDPVESGSLITDSGITPGGTQVQGVENTDVYHEHNATIKQLRLYQVLQQFHERIMRIGKRYRGYIDGLWGNDPEPNAVDIPQLVGSHFGRIQITDTITTADTEEASTANYRGNLNFYNNGTTHRYFCQDYGLLMCILNVMPNTGYSRGIHPAWTREVNTDFALDMFSGIGDQEITKKELWAIADNRIWGDTNEPYNDTIGYQDRFAEYKTRTNRIFNTGEIYESFYMGQIISGDYLNYPNIGIPGILVGQSNSATGDGIREADIFNEQPVKSGVSTYTDGTIYAHMYFTLKVKRCLPYFSTPGKMIL